MRPATVAVLVTALVTLVEVTALAEEDPAPPPSPFAGWDEGKVRKNRRGARLKILGNIRKWSAAKRCLALKCAMCAGAGRIQRSHRGSWVWLTCKRCDGNRYLPHVENWRVVHWDHHTERYRTPERQKALDRKLKDLRRNPRQATELQISRSKLKDLVVHGNWAEAEVIEYRGRVEALARQTWILDGKDWRLQVEVVDGPVFVRHDYPTETPDGAPAGPEDDTTPAYRVLEILDDLTIVVESDAGREVVALCAVEAKRQRLGDRVLEPAQVLRDLLLGEEIRLEDPGPRSARDVGGRRRAFVLRLPERLNVNAELVRQGYARVIVKEPYPHAAEMLAFEKRARRARKGIWGESR